jgi:gas vesicle protein GvpA/GvpJ/GvpM family
MATTGRIAPQASVAEVLDRVLDKGIVIDAWLRVSVAGITVLDIDARVVVASIETYLQRSEAIAGRAFASPAPAAGAPRRRRSPRPRRPLVRLRCESGCTFLRPAARRPAAVRCPADRSRTCAVTAPAPTG